MNQIEALRRLCESPVCDLQVTIVAELLRWLEREELQQLQATQLEEALKEFPDCFIENFFLTPEDMVRELGLDRWTEAVVIASEKLTSLKQVKKEAMRILISSLLPTVEELEEVLNH